MVRIIPQEKKSDSKTYEWHGVTETFSSPIQLKERLVDDFKDKLPGEFDVGYVAKRGNAKRWIHQAADLTSMYKQLGTSDTITLFAEGLQTCSSGGKRKRKADDGPSGTINHEDEVESVATKLQTMHGDKYNPQQLKLWARMIVNKQHKNFEEPPDIPIITGGIKKPRKNSDSMSEVICNAAVAITQALTPSKSSPHPLPSQKGSLIGVSPSSKATLTSNYISQLKSLQELREMGVLSDEEFAEQKRFALDNIRKLNNN